MSKAKKKGLKILSFLFCFLFLFLTGCDGGPSDDDFDDLEDPNNPGTSTTQSLEGVKVLSKPANYSFSDAVGDYSKNYYNLFSREVLNGLYLVYADYTEAELSNFCDKIDTANGHTFTNRDDNKYYLFDSPRFTITKIERKTEEEQEIVYLDLNSSWIWAPSHDVESAKIVFFNNEELMGTPQNNGPNSLKVTVNVSESLSMWQDVYNAVGKSNYASFYVAQGEGVEVKNDKGKTDYWKSPSYCEDEVSNYFQDALEYATYLFVLGYDYALPEDEAYFDFDINKNTGEVKVGGWESSKIEITEALGKVKELYQRLGNYVGVNQKNKEQIVKFIIDKVVGPNAYAKNHFTVKITENGGESELKFNRNYDQIIKNIVDYACSRAPIGFDKNKGENGETVTLENNYLASKITDYDGDYFFASYEDEKSDEIFKYIDEAEYQSLVLYPMASDVGKCFTDLWIAFEYNPDETLLPALDELVINVGFRYYSCAANGGEGGYVFSDDAPITIKKGAYAGFAEESPDTHWFYFSDYDGIADVTIPKGIEIGSQFKNPDAINPDKSDESEKNGDYSSMTITGNGEAREYYMLNDSSSYGAFGSLNGEKFSQASAGENACDFMEIYFDIQKKKGVIANYNFKVALVMYYAE